MEAALDSEQREMLNYGEAADLVGVPVGTLYSWVFTRAIPHFRLGARLVRFRRSELQRWLTERHVATRRGAPAAGAAPEARASGTSTASTASETD